VYSDPVDQKGEGLFNGLPQASLIVITHAHADHFQPKTIELLTGPSTVVFAPADVAATLIAGNSTYKVTNHACTHSSSLHRTGCRSYGGGCTRTCAIISMVRVLALKRVIMNVVQI
jgi:L-ascorbate metabolism protein UlaG (beta-lactamase superfamily)